MSSLQAETVSSGSSVPGLQIRVIYRDGGGQIHFDWPIDQIPHALEDEKGTLWVEIEDQTQNADRRVEELLEGVFHFHPLAIEDAVKDTHVAKVDDWGEYLYIVFHTIDFDPETDCVRLHELDIFLGRNYLVTYHNEPLKILDQLRRNIERDPTNRLKHGAGHLLYHILDMSVAEYLPAIEHLDDAIDAAQDEVFDRPTPRTLQAIFQVKRSALRLHRVLMPEREVLNRLARDEYDPVNPEHRVYFRDVYDHIVRIHDIAESLRDLISGALDTYLSAISNRTNDIMKAFTLVTVMFLPLSFLTSFFGMNFFGETLAFKSWLPKQSLFMGSCLIMIVMPGFLYLFAKRRGWF
ncbi:magnesium/cobalt transporter CorA [Singulisphaera acidiphila]|uniref:Magnesium transport protein CorA n=1 Tax=Singulisphaera acidiphila (strain ATCC BAA-1392 / DSM 18658 / VKM B-2454 / MOB10) TaxID=886293 RepID=L0DN57_SINAD|nr:magnesium/cobalt transporter CorA [Singulisphaera acidiphila]AGA30273.1 magnesium Mg(2+) and cobalt Co(2+) transport protein CorA [Singulisphaera acidiphila DSM 18658]